MKRGVLRGVGLTSPVGPPLCSSPRPPPPQVLHCHRMISMDFTGCTRLNDVAMLPFADASFKPGIETLILVGCPGIGDTGLSWVCDGVFESLVLLNIKGTRCTTSALRSCMDRFRYSKMRKNNTFFGLYPERRWKDRVVINECVGRGRGEGASNPATV